MATVNFPDEQRVLTGAEEISAFLSQFGIWYRHYDGPELEENASQDSVLAAYHDPIQELMSAGGYKTADVIDIKPDTPNLDAMLKKFNVEHWHDENEVRFIVAGRGLFHIHPTDRPVFAIEVVTGDMINVPRGTRHWFDLCSDRRIRAIRLFQDPAGWTPHYTDTGVDARYEPLCFGPEFIPAQRVEQRIKLD